MSVVLLVPRMLAPHLGDRTSLELPTPADGTLGGLLAGLAAEHPGFDRRVRDETGSLRRHVNLYVDGEDVRRLQGLATPVPTGAEVQVVQSVAGG